MKFRHSECEIPQLLRLECVLSIRGSAGVSGGIVDWINGVNGREGWRADDYLRTFWVVVLSAPIRRSGASPARSKVCHLSEVCHMTNFWAKNRIGAIKNAEKREFVICHTGTGGSPLLSLY